MVEKSQYTESNTEFKRNGNSIYNGEFLSYLLGKDFFNTALQEDLQCQQKFVDYYPDWVGSSTLNCIRGLETFNYRFPSVGVTQSLDEFHYRILEEGRTLRMFRGEYPYNRDVHKFLDDSTSNFIDDRPLQKGDAVIVSVPFSGTGTIHHSTHRMFDAAQDLNVPVFVDMAWFGTCANINIDLSHPAIQEVAFSTTKGLCTGDYRAGIRFSRHGKIDYTSGERKNRLALQADWTHGCHLNTRISLELMAKFGPDHQWNKYNKAQTKVCETYNLMPSNCIHIALGGENWLQFTRDKLYNRVNIGKVVKRTYEQDKK